MEEWRPVVGYEGLYEVSSLGRVRSLDRIVVFKSGPKKGQKYKLRGKIRKPCNDKDGTWRLPLSVNGIRKTHTVHSLVARAFLGPTPDGLVVCHGDKGRDYHAVSNLSFKTQRENLGEDRERDETSNKGERHGYAKLTEKDVLDIRSNSTMSPKELSAKYNVCVQHINLIIRRGVWKHI